MYRNFIIQKNIGKLIFHEENIFNLRNVRYLLVYKIDIKIKIIKINDMN